MADTTNVTYSHNVLNKGYVTILEYMGGDPAILRNARICYRSESKGKDSDRRLLRHLLRNRHMTPFEAAVFTFEVKAPIFVARQWMRHRVGSYNEESLRYCEAKTDFYVPEGLGYAEQSVWDEYNQEAVKKYNLLKDVGIPKEQARAVLPLGLYTRFVWTVNGSSLLNFLSLRLHKSAQSEIRQYAQGIWSLAYLAAPMTMRAYQDVSEKGDDE